MIKNIFTRSICRFFKKINGLKNFVKKIVGNLFFYLALKQDFITKNVLTKEQKLEIDAFYVNNYGKKISYKWHNLFTSYNGIFDVRYVPFDVCFSIVNCLNSNNDNCDILQDKNLLYNIAKVTNVKVAKRYFYSINKILFNGDDDIVSKEEFYKQISNIGEVFIKPTQVNNTGNVNKCKLLNIKNGIDIYSNTSIRTIIEKDYTDDFVVQEKFVCHKSISNIYPKAVNTFYVNTIILNNKVKVLNSVLQIGMGDNTVDWVGLNKNSLLILVNKDGTLHNWAICSKGRKRYSAHPDTGIVFKNHKIDLFPKILETLKILHLSVPWLKFCSWGITIDVSGTPVILEIKTPSYMYDQLLLGVGIFGEHTEEVLSYLKNKENS